MDFKELEFELDNLIDKLRVSGLLDIDKIKNEKFINTLNESSYLLTLHDVERYRPMLLNNRMKDFYGFKKNYLKGFNYLYYIKTIHPSMYDSLLKSVSFFRKDIEENLNLNYKLLDRNKKWKHVIGSTKTIIRDEKNNPKYALTLAIEHSNTPGFNYVDQLNSLTDREREILRLLCIGLSREELALCLDISHHTVQTHIKNLFKKLGVSKVSELIAINDKNFMFK